MSATSKGADKPPRRRSPGKYDVLARLFAKRTPAASAAAGLRVFKLVITFHPEGALDAPRTIRLSDWVHELRRMSPPAK